MARWRLARAASARTRCDRRRRQAASSHPAAALLCAACAPQDRRACIMRASASPAACRGMRAPPQARSQLAPAAPTEEELSGCRPCSGRTRQRAAPSGDPTDARIRGRSPPEKAGWGAARSGPLAGGRHAPPVELFGDQNTPACPPRAAPPPGSAPVPLSYQIRPPGCPHALCDVVPSATPPAPARISAI